MRKILFLLVIIPIFYIKVSADDFLISLEGEELKKVAVLELKLNLKPEKSFFLDEKFSVITVDNPPNSKEKVIDNQLLFKFVNSVNSSIKIFFAKPIETSRLLISGTFDRNNYSGPLDVSISENIFLPDFAKTINSSNIKSKILIKNNNEILPFHGISKANILGSKNRIYSKNLEISIGEIETYGFKLSGEINKAKINGQIAQIYDSKIICASIPVSENQIDQDLNIELEIDVDNNLVKKTIGSIHILDSEEASLSSNR